MTKKPKIRINQEGRDFALICALANTVINQIVLEEIYTKTTGCSQDDAKEHLTEIRKRSLPEVLAVLRLQGGLDVKAFLQRLDTYPVA